MQKDIDILSKANRGTADKIILWETFKFYVQGLLINQKVYLMRKKDELDRKGQDEIVWLETLHKSAPRLDMEQSKLKLREAKWVAREIVFLKQKKKAFEYRDTPNTYLLCGKQGGSPVPSYMILKEQMVVDAMRDKLHVFADYYEELYKGSRPEENEIDKFLGSVFIPKIGGGT